MGNQKSDILRPQRLSGFTGKETTKRIIATVVAGAIARKEPLTHVLLTGNAGLGKTTLANIIANELGAKILTTIGNNVDGEIIETIQELKTGDVLFIDEIHAVPKKWQEILYPALEDGNIIIKTKSGGLSWTTQETLPKITLIGATTEAGLLSKPLRDRFGLTFELEPYTITELVKILTRNAELLRVKICDYDLGQVLGAIAQRSRGTPRIANHFLKLQRDFLQADNVKGMEQPMKLPAVLETFRILGISDNGLTAGDLTVLRALQRAGEPLGAGNLSANCRIDRATIERVIEPFLLSHDFIARTGQGRIITKAGEVYLSEYDRRRGKNV